MHITSYQMHNVLNCYSRQLSQGRRGAKAAPVSGQGGVAAEHSESGGKRAATWEAVCLDIYNRLTDLESLNTAASESRPAADEQQAPEHHHESPLRQPATFVYNVIDRLDRKITNQISVEDSNGFVRRLEKKEREAVDSKLESWI